MFDFHIFATRFCTLVVTSRTLVGPITVCWLRPLGICSLCSLVTRGIFVPISVWFSLPTISQIEHLFSCAWKLRMSSKRKEYGIMLIIVLKRWPNSSWCVRAISINNPCCNDGKRVLQSGVKEQDATDADSLGGGKSQGIGSPPPSQGSGRGCDGLIDSFAPPQTWWE